MARKISGGGWVISVTEEAFTSELEGFATQQLAEYATNAVGYDGDMQKLSLVARKDDVLQGILYGRFFFGALHIKYLLVGEECRRCGIGATLLQQAVAHAKEEGCSFITVNTLNFQAAGFYKRFGFVEEFVQVGYSRGVSVIYLRYDL